MFRPSSVSSRRSRMVRRKCCSTSARTPATRLSRIRPARRALDKPCRLSRASSACAPAPLTAKVIEIGLGSAVVGGPSSASIMRP
jgi:hypothetical protein